MTRLRGTTGLCLLCALAFCALAAPNAFAAKGTTAFKCVKAEVGAQFSDAHCTKASTGAGYKHEAIAAGEKTTIAITNQKTESETTKAATAVIKFHIGPMDGEIRCSTVAGEGTLTNNAGTPMNVSGTATITYSECTVLPVVTFPECQLEKSSASSKATLSTPTEAMRVHFAHEAELFLKFTLVNCKGAGEDGPYQLTGSYDAIPNGTTWETTAESSKGLKSGGGQASIESKTTVTMSPSEPGISLTTTES
jgi:hypothetical protein